MGYITITYNTETGSDGTPNASMTVWEAVDGTRGRFSFQKWHRCPGCGIEYPESQMVRVNGSWRGVPCQCDQDVE